MSYLDSQDRKLVEEIALDILERSKSPIIEDAFDMISANNYNNRDMSTFVDVLDQVMFYASISIKRKKRYDIFDDERDLEDAIVEWIQVPVAVVLNGNNSIMDELDDKEYNSIQKLLDTYDTVQDHLEELEEDRHRGRRDSRSDRGRRGDRGRRSGRSSRDRGSRRGNSSRSERGMSETTKYRTGGSRRNEERDNRSKRGTRSTYGRKRSNREEVESVEDTQQEVTTVTKTLPQIFSANDEVFVEEYKDHELRRSVAGNDRSGKKVVPAFDYRNVRKMNNDADVEETKKAHITATDKFAFVSDYEYPPIYGTKISNGVDYTIALSARTSVIEIPTSENEVFSSLKNVKSFTDLHNVLCLLQGSIKWDDAESKSVNYTKQLALVELSKYATLMLNDMIATMMSSNDNIDDFIEDFDSFMTWANNPEQAQWLEMFEMLEFKYLQRHFRVAIGVEVDTLKDETDLTLPDNVNEGNELLAITNDLLVVRTYGSILSESLSAIKTDEYVVLDYDLVPAFHTAIMRILTYRNNNLPLAHLYLTDTNGTTVKVIASGRDAPIIKIKFRD